jgi:hypothetical protein
MNVLSDALKKMLAGLAHQDAGEFLSAHEKMEILGYGGETREKSSAVSQKTVKRPATKRIALISDGRGLGAPLDYAIDACLRQDAQLDLLVHGTVDTNSISLLEKQIQRAGLDCQHIRLGVHVVDDIIEYIYSQPSLIFLVAMPDDAAVRVLIEEVIPRHGGRIPVPLVLIEEKRVDPTIRQSAA